MRFEGPSVRIVAVSLVVAKAPREPVAVPVLTAR